MPMTTAETEALANKIERVLERNTKLFALEGNEIILDINLIVELVLDQIEVED